MFWMSYFSFRCVVLFYGFSLTTMIYFLKNGIMKLTRAVLGFRGLYLECLVYGRMFVTCSVCVWLLLVMLRVCWLSVLVVGWCSKGCRLWLFGLDPTGTLMSAVVPSIFSWLASRLFVVSGWIVLLTYRDGSSKVVTLIVCLID